jgi:hypothetical protein
MAQRYAEHPGTSLATRLLIEANPGRAADLAKIDELVLQQHADRCQRLEAAQAIDSVVAELYRVAPAACGAHEESVRLSARRLVAVAAQLRGSR